MLCYLDVEEMDSEGDLPKEGARIEFEHFDVVAKKMNGPRIVLLRVHPKQLDQELLPAAH